MKIYVDQSKWRHMQTCEALQGTKMMTPPKGETSSSRPQSGCSTFGSTNDNILEYAMQYVFPLDYETTRSRSAIQCFLFLRYETAIFEALESSKDPRGSGIITIAGFIKVRCIVELTDCCYIYKLYI